MCENGTGTDRIRTKWLRLNDKIRFAVLEAPIV
jgi:hypothetical protein